MKPFFAAVKFLTIVPVPERLTGGTEALKESVLFFPLVGLLIGIAAAGFDRVLFPHLPPFTTSILVLMLLVAASGGLHMDGLADTADGFLSSRPKERMLEIMRDSRTGVMGTIAVVFLILFKVSVLNAISLEMRWKTILLMPLAGRIAVVLTMAFLPYVRTGGGLATVFQGRPSRLHALWAVAFLFVSWWLMGGWMGFAAGLLPIAAAVLFMFYSVWKIGGFTGDTLGAVCEIAEGIPPFALLFWV